MGFFLHPVVPRALAVAATVLASPVLARDVYECIFPEVRNNMGYLATRVVFSPNEDKRTVSLVDEIIQQEKGGPIEVPIAEENDRKLSVSWQIMLQSTANDYVKMAYRLSMQKSGLTASLTGRPQGYSNTFTATGKCTRKRA